MRRKIRFASVLFTAALSLAASGVGAPSAQACGNSVLREVDPRMRMVARAERALEDGEHTKAAVGALQAFPDIHQTKGGTWLATRAARVLALAAVRTGGSLTVGKDFRGTTPEERSANLAWATSTMRELNKARPNDPAVQTDLAETLAATKASEGEAKAMLEALATKDLVATAQGYAALARLRAAARDAAGRDAALAKCKGMASDPGVCTAAPTREAAASKGSKPTQPSGGSGPGRS